MKKLLCVAAMLFAIPNVHYAQWINTNYYTSDIGNNGIFQIIEKDNMLFAATSQGIFKSTNNGEFWTNASKGLPEVRFAKIVKCKNSLITFNTDYFPNSKGFYMTTNNGEFWQYKSTNIEEPIELIEAKNDSLFAGTQKGIYYSTDEGSVWTKSTIMSLTGTISIRDFDFVGNSLFCASGFGLLLSTDGGITWSKIPKLNNCNKLFYSKGDLYIVSNARLLITKDLGKTLTTISINTNGYPNAFIDNLNDEFIIENDTMYYGVPGYLTYNNPQGLYISVDKGVSWQKKWDNPLNVAGAICFYKNRNAWFQGTLFGGVYKSTNQGASWQLSSNGMVSPYTVPNLYCDLLLPKPADTRYPTSSPDEGSTWSLLSPLNKELNFYGCYFNKYFAFSPENGIQISDDGKIWNNSGNGLPIASSSSTMWGFEIDNNTIYAKTMKFGYYKSVDEGKTYTFAFNVPKGNSRFNTPQTFISGEKVFSVGLDSLDSPYYVYRVEAGDTTWSPRSNDFAGKSIFNISTNNGQSWNKSMGLPPQFMTYNISKNENQIVIMGFEFVTELTNRVIDLSTGIYKTQVIKKPFFRIYNSVDFGISFTEVKIDGIKKGIEYSGNNWIENKICKIEISDNVGQNYSKQLYSLDKGLTWKDASLIALKLRIRNILKYKNVHYLTSDSLGLLSSANNGVTWEKITTINAENNVGIKELNGILFCHHEKGLYYLKDNQWNSIAIGELPSSIYQIGASETSLFVTTFRDGIWKYPMANILATEQEARSNALTKVYPNPANDLINLEFVQTGNYYIKILTYTGIELQSHKTNNVNATSLSIKGLPHGLYLLKIESDGNSTYQKIMVSQ